MLISDTANRRIRSLNILTGVVDTLIGNGTLGDQSSQISPLQSNMRAPRDIDVFKHAGSEFPLYVDSSLAAGVNNNTVRALNSYGSTENVLNTDIDPGKSNIIAGIINQVSWAGGNLALFNNQPAVITPINGPAGIAADGLTNVMYVGSYTDHCIHKVDSSGLISVYAGLCGTLGTTSGTLATVRFTNPWDMEMDPMYPGNFFVIDNPGGATSYLKYVNTSGTARSILGTVVNGGSVETIGLSPGPNYSNAIAVNSDQICFANGRFTGATPALYGTQSVVCYSRAGSGSLSLYLGNRNTPSLGTPFFRGRQPKYDEDEGREMDVNGIDPVNNPAQLSGPEGLAFDGEGNLYITETKGHTIRMVKKWY